MHFSVLLFHCSDEGSVMAKHFYDANEEDGANIVFNQEYTIEQAEEEYAAHIKANPKDKNEYPDVESFMDAYYGCRLNDEDDEKFYGRYSNEDGTYDWYEVGGRWANLLPDMVNKKELKKELAKALDMKNKEVEEKYRDNVEEYLKLKTMPLEEACQALNIGRTNSIQICKEIPAEKIIEFWIREHKRWGNSTKREDAMVTEYFILEDGPNGGGEVINGVSVDLFVDTYNYYLKRNEKQHSMSKFYLTILDLHT